MEGRLTREEIAALTFANDQEWMAAEEHLDTIEIVLRVLSHGPNVMKQVLAEDVNSGVYMTIMKCCALVVGRIYLLQEERENQDAE